MVSTVGLAVVDSVPVLWTASGRRDLRATLRFRAGQADESLATLGSLHLLEHAVLHGVQAPAQVQVNGSVSALFTSFDLAGPPELVSSLLEDLIARLSDLRPSELHHEARVIEQEARLREGGPLGTALFYRWGAQGPGLLNCREFGLMQFDGDRLASLAREAFALENAAIALDGPVPDGLHVALTDGGTRWPVALPAWVNRFPGAALSEYPIVSGLVGRDAADVLAISVAAARANRALRTAHPDARWNLHLLDLGEMNHVTLSGPTDERSGEASRLVLAELDRLVAEGPRPDELDEYRIQHRLDLASPAASQSRPWLALDDVLLGRDSWDLDSWSAELETVTTEQVQAAAFRWRDSVLVTVPDRAQQPEALPWVSGDDQPRLAASAGARVFVPRRDVPDRAGVSIAVSPAQIQHATSTRTVTIDLDRVALLGRRPDGQRLLIGETGSSLTIEPTLWRDSAALTASLDATVPAERTVDLGAREASDIPLPLRPAQRLLGLLFGGPIRVKLALLVGCIAVCVGLGWLLVVLDLRGLLGGIGVLFGFAVLGIFTNWFTGAATDD